MGKMNREKSVRPFHLSNILIVLLISVLIWNTGIGAAFAQESEQISVETEPGSMMGSEAASVSGSVMESETASVSGSVMGSEAASVSGSVMESEAASVSGSVMGSETEFTEAEGQVSSNEAYDIQVVPLEREGVELYLECIKVEGGNPQKNILLAHGVTYSSHEFDINYKDYSLARRLAREGYAAWLLDIAGFGSSGEVEDGFLPDSDYAAEDIHAAADKIISLTGQEKIDVLGWSWGTVTSSRFVGAHPELVNRYVMYAPILSGIGEYAVEEPFHHNTWEHAADDFQRTEDGEFDYNVVDPVMIEMFCSSSWHYDGENSPNGGRRDICVADTEILIDLEKIAVPTLVICGDKDPYLNYDLVNASLDSLPENSELEMIEGASHVILYEEPFYRDFQDRLVRFLES